MNDEEISLAVRDGDRRRRPTSLVDALVGPTRRRRFRRTGEGENQYVDRLRRRTVGLVIAIVLACALDALFTLLHVGGGAVEANPLMAMALERGDGAFLALKFAITIVGVWLLAVHQNFRVGLRGLYVVAVGYVVLIAYHVILLIR